MNEVDEANRLLTIRLLRLTRAVAYFLDNHQNGRQPSLAVLRRELLDWGLLEEACTCNMINGSVTQHESSCVLMWNTVENRIWVADVGSDFYTVVAPTKEAALTLAGDYEENVHEVCTVASLLTVEPQVLSEFHE